MNEISYLWKIIHAHVKCKDSSSQEVGDLKSQSGPISILTLDQITHFIVDADTESSINVVHLKQPTHAYQHQMEIVYCRTLNNPIYSTRQKLQRDHNKENCIHVPHTICHVQLTMHKSNMLGTTKKFHFPNLTCATSGCAGYILYFKQCKKALLHLSLRFKF